MCERQVRRAQTANDCRNSSSELQVGDQKRTQVCERRKKRETQTKWFTPKKHYCVTSTSPSSSSSSTSNGMQKKAQKSEPKEITVQIRPPIMMLESKRMRVRDDILLLPLLSHTTYNIRHRHERQGNWLPNTDWTQIMILSFTAHHTIHIHAIIIISQDSWSSPPHTTQQTYMQ